MMFGLTPYRTRSAVSYNPFREMEEFQRAFFGNRDADFFRGGLAEFKTDVSDNGDSYLLEADLPGFAKEDIHLDLNGDVLTISAERHSEKEDKRDNYICSERSYGSFSRAFNVAEVDTDNITAKYEDGVLKLVLPKRAEVLPQARRLEIQ